MRRVSRIVVERVARCPFSVAHEYAEDYLRDAERSVEVRVPLRDFIAGLPGAARAPVKMVFALHPDEAESGRLHDALAIEWHAGTRLFPLFHGTLRLRIASVDSTLLTFEGAYRPPMGPVGVVFDASWAAGSPARRCSSCSTGSPRRSSAAKPSTPPGYSRRRPPGSHGVAPRPPSRRRARR